MLERLQPTVAVLDRKPRATESQLTALVSRYPAVPGDHLQLLREATEIELQLPRSKYVRIWGPADCIDQDEGYGISRRMPGAIPIGDDGGGSVLFYLDGKEGFGLYRVGYGNLDAEDAIRVAPSLTEFLCNGVGFNML